MTKKELEQLNDVLLLDRLVYCCFNNLVEYIEIKNIIIKRLRNGK